MMRRGGSYPFNVERVDPRKSQHVALHIHVKISDPLATMAKRKAAGDFQKTKKKLGKGKQVNANVTDTSFKARTIALPQQSVTVDRSQSLTTRRNQTLPELASLTRHATPGVRRDAVQGMHELATRYPELVVHDAGALLHPVLALIGDDDRQVRAALRTYLGAVLRAMEPAQLAPFAPALLLFTTSALSHIATTVRLDALLVLELLLETMPRATTEAWHGALDGAADGHGKRVLQAFFALLGVGAEALRGTPAAVAGSIASVDLQPGDRLRVLRALDRFLRAAEPQEEAELPLWCFQTAFRAPSDLEQFETLFEEPHAGSPWELALLGRTATGEVRYAGHSAAGVHEALCAGAAGGEAGARPAHERLAGVLHASLVATLLDAASSALAPSGARDGVQMELLATVLSISTMLWRRAVMEHVAARAALGTRAPALHMAPLQQMVAHLTPHFPVDGAETLNALYCELVAVGLVGAQYGGARRERLQDAMRRTLGYLVERLRSGALPHELYHALLPTFWLLLSADEAPVEEQAELLVALLDHFAALPTGSGTKPLAFAFLARLALLHTYASLAVAVPALQAPEAHAPLQAWLLALPRVLWEAAKARAPRFAHALLAFLRSVLVQADDVLFTRETRAALAPRLRPLFAVQHPSKGEIAGPVHRLPAHTQRLAVSLAHYTRT